MDLLQSYSQAKESCSLAAQTGPSSQTNPEDDEENIFESLLAVTWKQDVTGKGPAQGQDPDPATAQASTVRTEDPARSAA